METNPTTRLEDLAKQAGVSISTASRALNDSPAVNVRTKQKIWKLAREMDYPFRHYMPAGPIGANATITIVVPRPQSRGGRMADPFFFELLSGIGDAARERGCDILLSYIAPSSYEELATRCRPADQMALCSLGSPTLHDAFNRLAEVEDRFVSGARRYRSRPIAPSVVTMSRAGAVLPRICAPRARENHLSRRLRCA